MFEIIMFLLLTVTGILGGCVMGVCMFLIFNPDATIEDAIGTVKDLFKEIK